MKIAVSQAVTQADLCTSDMSRFKGSRQQLSNDIVRVLSSTFIIVQSDTRNIEYLICWLQKISLDYLLFEYLYQPLVFAFCKEIVCLIFKSLLIFLTFVNYEGPYTV